MKETDIAWAAGLLDGEGSFAIKRQVRSDIFMCNYQLWTTCGMSDTEPNKEAILKLQAMFGGSYYIRKRKEGEVRNGAIYWSCVSQKGYEMLKLLLPYLVVKKQQAQLLIEFQETCKSRKGPKRDIEKVMKQESFFYRIREHNFKNKLYLQRLSEKTSKEDATV